MVTIMLAAPLGCALEQGDCGEEVALGEGKDNWGGLFGWKEAEEACTYNEECSGDLVCVPTNFDSDGNPTTRWCAALSGELGFCDNWWDCASGLDCVATMHNSACQAPPAPRGDECSEDGSWCSGNIRYICDDGYLDTLDCDDVGKTCLPPIEDGHRAICGGL